MSAIRGPRARLLRAVQNDESERREDGLPIMGLPTGFDMFLMDRYAHTPVLGPVAGGKTPGGPKLFVVKR